MFDFLKSAKSKREQRQVYRGEAIRRRWCDPTAVRHWHNPADPIQAARIEAAAVKRARRAGKLQRDALESRNSNRAHIATRLDKIRMLKSYDLPNRFNPFYVAK